MLKNPEFYLFIIGLCIWSVPFWDCFDENQESSELIEARRKRLWHETFGACGVLFAAGFCGWTAALWSLGIYDESTNIWKINIPVIFVSAISPIYSFIKWMKLQ